MADSERIIGEVNRLYNKIMIPHEVFIGSGNHNLGYWEDDTQSWSQAAQELYRKVFELIPYEQRKGNILEVACGFGGCARFLAATIGIENLTCINISDIQLRECKKKVPGCNFLLMDAVKLGFGDGKFDNMISIEAAFHFETREEFFSEAYRTLKPGGWFALSDILMDNAGTRGWDGVSKNVIPSKNYFCGNWDERIENYTLLFRKSGFTEISILEVTAKCTYALISYLRSKKNYISFDSGRDFVDRMKNEQGWMPYVLACARKPLTPL